MKPSKIKIALTGGHAATPAIAVINELKKTFSSNLDVAWIGSEVAISGTKIKTTEYKILPEIGVKFYPIIAGKIQTKFTRYTILNLLKIPIGFAQSFYLLLKLRPKVVLSFGGFASFPVVFWAYLLGIPIVIHEQTAVYGRATKLSSFFASKIALARNSSLKYFPKDKSIVVGNPVREDILRIPFKHKPGHPMKLLIMGGSRGSHFINEISWKVIDELINKYEIIHITGELDYQKALEARNKLSTELKKRYQVLSFVNPTKMSEIYMDSDIVISRAGANSVSELIAIKRPSVLIPLPFAFMNEQLENANFAKEFGIAEVLKEKEATPETLLSVVNRQSQNWEKIIMHVKDKDSPDKLAAIKLVKIVASYLS